MYSLDTKHNYGKLLDAAIKKLASEYGCKLQIKKADK